MSIFLEVDTAYYWDWANLLLRWLHLVVGIAWIGASFYFVFLDQNLLPPTDPELKKKGVDGAVWAVHGGGFYHPQKYMLVPPGRIDSHLHWFYWESYSTWLSGLALFSVTYLLDPGVWLVSPGHTQWSPTVAVGLAVLFPVVFWLAYDAVCRLWGATPQGEQRVGIAVLLMVIFSSWLATQWFPGRAAFLIVGISLATMMSANVFFVIIPGQRKIISALEKGLPPDPIHGLRGKQRSVHNTYFTLPVLFTMFSNHYSFMYTHAYNWVVLVLMMLAGALIRHFFVARHGWKQGRVANPWGYAVSGVLVLVLVMVGVKNFPEEGGGSLSGQKLSSIANSNTAANGESNPAVGSTIPLGTATSYRTLAVVLEQRCYMCHGATVQMKNVRLDSPSDLKKHAPTVYEQVVLKKAMPLGNSTGITEAERNLIKEWFVAGAVVE